MLPARVATYRVQLTARTDFAHVRSRLGHLARLGVSHLYLSPVTEAVRGSTHGYDVVDHTRVREELGGQDGLVALLDAAHEHGLAVVVDHVANHASVARPELNGPWWTMLGEGRASPAARWFDVDWAAAGDKVQLPVLGEPAERLLAAGAFHVDRDRRELRLGGQRWPLAAGTERLDDVGGVLAGQHYELLHWRRPERNVRRFFTIDDLAAVCVEHAEVAHAVDTIPRLLAAHPAFGGVRVDHVDGLAHPGEYLAGLREVIGAGRWLLVEKILAPGEALPPSWPVDGTTGYEHARIVEHAFADVSGVASLTSRWQSLVGDHRPFTEWELEARREVLDGGLAPDVARVVGAARQAGFDGATATDVHEAVIELSVHLRRYRTYLAGDAASVDALTTAAGAAAARRPDLAGTVEALAATLGDPHDDADRELLVRWQQLTGPATAKGVEDRTFFRYVPASSLCEVGGDPSPPAEVDRIVELHEHHRNTAERWPMTLLAGTTHDTKRSEDVRARGLALFADPEPWLDAVAAFDVELAGTGAPAAWLALQTTAMASPITSQRLEAFLVKSEREADVRTTWADPDEAYEGRLATLAEHAAAAELPDTREAGSAISLGMLAIRCTAPGVPDVYQGTEAWRYLLVDPDNRAEPDEGQLERLVRLAADDGVDLPAAFGSGAERAVVLTRLLALRRRIPAAFGPGSGYLPLLADDGGVVAFARLDHEGMAQVVVAVPTPAARRDGGRAGTIALPDGPWHDVLVDDAPPLTGQIDVLLHLAALGDLPALVLTRSAVSDLRAHPGSPR